MTEEEYSEAFPKLTQTYDVDELRRLLNMGKIGTEDVLNTVADLKKNVTFSARIIDA